MSHASPHAARPDPALLVPLKFRAAVLVCGDCEKRDSGPRKLDARDVRKELKRHLADAQVKLRVVQSSCLGLCPKKAMALVAVGAGAPPLAAEVRSEAEAASFAASVVLSFK